MTATWGILLRRKATEHPFHMLTVVGGGIGDPTTILALGCAFRAALSDGEAEFREAISRETKMIEEGKESNG